MQTQGLPSVEQPGAGVGAEEARRGAGWARGCPAGDARSEGPWRSMVEGPEHREWGETPQKEGG